MAVYQRITDADVKSTKSTLNQLIDIVQADISGSTTRQKFQVFVTGGQGPGVTSSLFQTIYDQDFTLQTANPIFDMTVGLYYSSSIVTGSSTGEDANGKLLFPSQTLMMREKINVYKQFAQLLNGSATSRFYSPYGSSTATDAIDAALFINVKRLFARDSIKRETFAMKIYATASNRGGDEGDKNDDYPDNLHLTSTGSAMIITDIGANSAQQKNVFGGGVGRLVNSANTADSVGLIYYDEGIVILNMANAISGTQRASGSIDAMTATAQTIDTATIPAGKTLLGEKSTGNPRATFIEDFMVSASMDNIIDHFASCRFQSGSALTAATFQNQTAINSTLFFCRAPADSFNYSSNPTYIDSQNKIVVIDPANPNSRAFTMPTTIGLYDGNENLLAVAKLSRPVEKNDSKDITFRVRLDF